jgi:hypothetical protein
MEKEAEKNDDSPPAMLSLYRQCAATPNSAATCMASVRSCTSMGYPS